MVAHGGVYNSHFKQPTNVVAAKYTTRTGRRQWVGPDESGPFGIATDEDSVYVLSGDLYSLDAETGAVNWRVTPPGRLSAGPPKLAGETLFCAIQAYDGVPATLSSIDTTDGAVVWEKAFEDGTDIDSTVAVANGSLYVGTSQNRFLCLDGDSGDIVWRADTDEDVTVRPTVAGETVYVADAGGTVYALSTVTGETRWQTGSSPPQGGFACTRSGVYYASEYGIHRFDTADGAEMWRFEATEPTTPAVDSTAVYFGTGYEERKLYVVDAEKGATRWSYTVPEIDTENNELAGGIYHPVALVESGLFVQAEDALYAFSTE